MRRSIWILIMVGVILGTVIYLRGVNINRPGNHQGYAPEQPIAFSHQQHAGDLQISCTYCHSGVERSQTAEVPPAGTCMNCHEYVTAAWEKIRMEQQQAEEEDRDPRKIVSPEIKKLYASVRFNPESREYSWKDDQQPIRWVKVHNLPDFVTFSHERHVNAGVDCQRCHGEVASMRKVEQAKSLSMGWCVNCHRDVNNDKISGLSEVNASTDCGACHY